MGSCEPPARRRPAATVTSVRVPRPAAIAVALAAATAPTALAAPPAQVVYAPIVAANVLHDGVAGAPGLAGALIQGPVGNDRRWPLARQMAKLSGADLAPLSAAAMTTALRREIRRRDRAGVVGIDEIAPGAWTAAAAGNLAAALDALGPERGQVLIYVSGAMVGGIGRVDPRQALDARQAAVLEALRRAGAVYLEAYSGTLAPFGAVEMATYSTRWQARWAPGEASALRLLIGPAAGGVTQAEIWERARSSAAGRALLANGIGAYGVRSAAEAAAWLSGYRGFTANPSTPPPAGDVAVPVGGGLTVGRTGDGPLLVTLARPGRVVVQLVPSGRSGGRVIRKLTGPFGPTSVPIPVDTVPGEYQARVVAIGDGLRDEAGLALTVARPAGLTVRIADARSVAVRVPRAVPAVVRLVPAGQTRGSVIRRLNGPGESRIALRPGLAAGRYTVVAVIVRGGREEVRLAVRIRRDGLIAGGS